MTAEQITKALENCFQNDWQKTKCNECPFYTATVKCMDDLKDSAIELINYQKQEIEELESELLTVKLEAVEEFAERLKREALISQGYEVLQSGTIGGLVEEIKSTHEKLKEKEKLNAAIEYCCDRIEEDYEGLGNQFYQIARRLEELAALRKEREATNEMDSSTV